MNKFVLFLILCSIVTISAIAQDNTGAIKGVVLNADKKPAAAASVQLTDKQIIVTTNEHGIFTFSNLFLDGMPMDNFGSSLSLYNLPVNMAERIARI